jgi:hypothetical protein
VVDGGVGLVASRTSAVSPRSTAAPATLRYRRPQQEVESPGSSPVAPAFRWMEAHQSARSRVALRTVSTRVAQRPEHARLRVAGRKRVPAAGRSVCGWLRARPRASGERGLRLKPPRRPIRTPMPSLLKCPLISEAQACGVGASGRKLCCHRGRGLTRAESKPAGRDESRMRSPSRRERHQRPREHFLWATVAVTRKKRQLPRRAMTAPTGT